MAKSEEERKKVKNISSQRTCCLNLDMEGVGRAKRGAEAVGNGQRTNAANTYQSFILVGGMD